VRYPGFFFLLIFGLALHATSAQAGASDNCGGIRVSGVSVCTGSVTGIAEDAEIEGVTVINGKVFIDGVPVRPGVSRVTSKKTRKNYLIKTDKNGNVSVDEQ
jgi:hypothetical protein